MTMFLKAKRFYSRAFSNLLLVLLKAVFSHSPSKPFREEPCPSELSFLT